MILAIVIAAVLIAAGIGLWANTEWWRPLAVVGSDGLLFQPWSLFVEAVNAAVIVSLVWLQ